MGTSTPIHCNPLHFTSIQTNLSLPTPVHLLLSKKQSMIEGRKLQFSLYNSFLREEFFYLIFIYFFLFRMFHTKYFGLLFCFDSTIFSINWLVEVIFSYVITSRVDMKFDKTETRQLVIFSIEKRGDPYIPRHLYVDRLKPYFSQYHLLFIYFCCLFFVKKFNFPRKENFKVNTMPFNL